MRRIDAILNSRYVTFYFSVALPDIYTQNCFQLFCDINVAILTEDFKDKSNLKLTQMTISIFEHLNTKNQDGVIISSTINSEHLKLQ